MTSFTLDDLARIVVEPEAGPAAKSTMAKARVTLRPDEPAPP
jgi:hypothetical protein